MGDPLQLELRAWITREGVVRAGGGGGGLAAEAGGLGGGSGLEVGAQWHPLLGQPLSFSDAKSKARSG